MINNPPIDELAEKVGSKYGLCVVASKRARQLIAGEEPLVRDKGQKPLSIAVEELYKSKVKIVSEEEQDK